MPEGREAKRARQACVNCRRKKARCSGERPICMLCFRLKQHCKWPEHGSEGLSRTSSHPSYETNLAARVALLESKLSLLNDENLNNFLYSPRGGPSRRRAPNQTSPSLDIPDFDSSWNELSSAPQETNEIPSSFSSLPSKDMIRILIDVYFQHCHNQPYSYFHESTFREQYEEDLLPDYLLYAFIATAVRFCDHPLFQDHQRDAIESYANSSWAEIFEQCFSQESYFELGMVQATNMLAVIDFTSARQRIGWVKIGLSVRLAQGLRLNEEPEVELSSWEKEERRRTFWSVYLLDRLVSCGPNRPPTFTDEDCTVRLPSPENSFRNKEACANMVDLQTLIDDPTLMFQWHPKMDHFALTSFMASLLGRIIRYCLKFTSHNTYMPWDSRSPYYAIHGLLLHFESHSALEFINVSQALSQHFTNDGLINQQHIGHFIFSHVLFHLNHCLLNHPFLLHHRFQTCAATVPPSFLHEALQRCHKHAYELLQLLHIAKSHGCLVETSFYGYCALTAGAIHRLYEHHENANIAKASREAVQMAIQFLEQNLTRWDFWPLVVRALKSFLPDPQAAKTLINATLFKPQNPVRVSRIFWQLLDYATCMSELPSLSEESPRIEESDEMLTNGISLQTQPGQNASDTKTIDPQAIGNTNDGLGIDLMVEDMDDLWSSVLNI